MGVRQKHIVDKFHFFYTYLKSILSYLELQVVYHYAF